MNTSKEEKEVVTEATPNTVEKSTGLVRKIKAMSIKAKILVAALIVTTIGVGTVVTAKLINQPSEKALKTETEIVPLVEGENKAEAEDTSSTEILTDNPTPIETVVVTEPIEVVEEEIIVEDRNEYAIVPTGSMKYSAREEGNPELGILETETAVLVFAELSNGYSYVLVEATGEEYGVLTSVLQPYTDSASTVTPTTTPTKPTSIITDLSMLLYAKQSVNVRSGPSTDYAKLGSLTKNQEVTITGQASNGWYCISYNGKEGYVSNTYLTDTKSTVATTPVKTPTAPTTTPVTQPVTTPTTTPTAPVTAPTTTPVTTPVAETWTLDVNAYIAELEANLRSAGKVTITEYVRATYGVDPMTPNTDGAGYNEMYISSGNYQWSADTVANMVINAYYIEYQGIKDGCYVIRIYIM